MRRAYWKLQERKTGWPLTLSGTFIMHRMKMTARASFLLRRLREEIYPRGSLGRLACLFGLPGPSLGTEIHKVISIC